MDITPSKAKRWIKLDEDAGHETATTWVARAYLIVEVADAE